jgi:DNA-binding transcriptional ArsR family regulator
MSKRRPDPRAAVVALAATAPVFAALGDPTRLRLIARLGEGGAQSIVRLTEGSDVTRQAVTKHLRVLEQAGLARATRAGREQVWTLDAAPLDAARRSLELVSQRWDERLARLKALVEEE